jgi:hypothetical protein
LRGVKKIFFEKQGDKKVIRIAIPFKNVLAEQD